MAERRNSLRRQLRELRDENAALQSYVNWLEEELEIVRGPIHYTWHYRTARGKNGESTPLAVRIKFHRGLARK